MILILLPTQSRRSCVVLSILSMYGIRNNLDYVVGCCMRVRTVTINVSEISQKVLCVLLLPFRFPLVYPWAVCFGFQSNSSLTPSSSATINIILIFFAFLYTLVIGDFKVEEQLTKRSLLSSNYQYSANVLDNLELSWSIVDSNTLSVQLSGPLSGWIAVGFSQQLNYMVGSTAVLGWDQGTSNNKIAAYYLGGKVTSSIIPSTTFVLDDPSVVTVDGTTVIKFKTPIDGQFIKKNGSTPIIAAYSRGSYQLIVHESRGSASVDFSTGSAVSIVSTTDQLKTVHSVLVSLGWLIFMPIGIFFARYGKDLPNNVWFKVHLSFQLTGFVLSLVGIIIIIIAIKTPALVTPHHVIGFILLILSVFQVVYAAFRPHPPAAGEEKSMQRSIFELVHHWNGRICIVLAAINVFFGITIRGIENPYIYEILLAALIVGLVSIIIGLEITTRIGEKYKAIKIDDNEKIPEREEEEPYLSL